MQNFFEWLKIRENTNPNTEAALSRIAQIAWKSHNLETRAFLRKLTRIDPEIAEEFKRIDTTEDLPIPSNNSSEKDEIRASVADSSPGLGED